MTDIMSKGDEHIEYNRLRAGLENRKGNDDLGEVTMRTTATTDIDDEAMRTTAKTEANDPRDEALSLLIRP